MNNADVTSELLQSIRSCTICSDLPLGPRPIVQFSRASRLLIVGQAPGRITHNKGIPFDDPSGDRLRSWLGINKEAFYNKQKIAIVPMGFCFPGTGKGGDLPPRTECAEAWRSQIIEEVQNVELTLIIGRYAIDWHLPDFRKHTVTDAVKSWADVWPDKLILPHPSPRNNRWLKQNPWFDQDIIPALQNRVRTMFNHSLCLVVDVLARATRKLRFFEKYVDINPTLPLRWIVKRSRTPCIRLPQYCRKVRT